MLTAMSLSNFSFVNPSRPFHVISSCRGPQAERDFPAVSAPAGAVNDPFQHAHVLTIAGPEKFSVRILPEPVHRKHSRRVRQLVPEPEPVAEIIRHVVSAERKHGEGVA